MEFISNLEQRRRCMLCRIDEECKHTNITPYLHINRKKKPKIFLNFGKQPSEIAETFKNLYQVDEMLILWIFSENPKFLQQLGSFVTE